MHNPNFVYDLLGDETHVHHGPDNRKPPAEPSSGDVEQVVDQVAHALAALQHLLDQHCLAIVQLSHVQGQL